MTMATPEIIIGAPGGFTFPVTAFLCVPGNFGLAFVFLTGI